MADRPPARCPRCGWGHPAPSMVAAHITDQRCGKEPDHETEHRRKGI